MFAIVQTIVQAVCLLVLVSPVHNEQCDLPECYAEAKRLMESINDRVDACEDFVEFACGKQFPLFDRLSESNRMGVVAPTIYHLRLWGIRKILRAVLDEPLDNADHRAIKLAKIYWKKCKIVNSKDALEGVRSLFKQLGGWPAITDAWNDSHFSWMEFSKWSRRLGFLPAMFIHVGVNVDDVHQPWNPNDTIKLTIQRPVHTSRLVDDNLGYLRIAKFLTQSRIPEAKEIDDAFQFGREFHMLECGGHGAVHMTEMSIKILQELYPIVDWMKYLTAILTTNQRKNLASADLIIADTCFLTSFNDLFKRTSKRVQANYAFLTLIDDMFRLVRPELALAFAENQREREDICFDSTATIFAKALDIAIVEKIPPGMKAKISDMKHRIRGKTLTSILAIPWMDYETKMPIVNQMDGSPFVILAPDGILDDKYFNRLELLQTDAIQTYFIQINGFLVDHYYLQAGRPRNEYEIHGRNGESISFLDIFSPNDLLIKPDSLGKQIYVPAASILTRKILLSKELEFLNYATVGREIATALGISIYKKNWFSSIDSMKNPLPSKSMLNHFTSLESCYTMAFTQAGLEMHSAVLMFSLIGAAELTYKIIFDDCQFDDCGVTLPNFNYTPQQIFWMHAITSDCDRDLKYRYNTMLSNNEAFVRDFNCQFGSKMNSRNKCKIFT
ncbi:neprilysin-1 isoform X2 [Fopius arisanus]|uniref:Mmel1_1 protein n=2 Tax=Fopius arisanus TaxID=64838 RepID=A0A0C9RAH1_9HYME|nr:PREDICTED: neprilysin-1-like isoform X2 [Fopius arisanus]